MEFVDGPYIILQQQPPQELMPMKNKRPKSSIYYHSTKNKSQKQGQKSKINTFEKKEFDSNHMKASFSEEKRFIYENPKFKTERNTQIGNFLMDDLDSPKRPDYTYKKEPATKTYQFGFTNSKFIYFLGKLTPKEYLLFVTLIGLLIVEDLNETEAKIIYAFTSNIADTMQTLVEQEIILGKYNHAEESNQLSNALHEEFEVIYEQMEKLRTKYKT